MNVLFLVLKNIYFVYSDSKQYIVETLKPGFSPFSILWLVTMLFYFIILKQIDQYFIDVYFAVSLDPNIIKSKCFLTKSAFFTFT